MTSGPPSTVSVIAEPVGVDPLPWAYALYYGHPRSLLVRSQAAYGCREDAMTAGNLEVAKVGRNLRRVDDTK